MRIERIRETYDVSLRWVHFPLHPETPNEGRTLEELFAGRGMDIEAMQAQMRERMEAEGLPYGRRTHTYNSRLAQELGAWADTQPGGEALHAALYRAYFVDARNIGDLEELVSIASDVGLDAAAAREVLEQRSFSERVDEDWALSRRYGVTGVPTFVAGGYGVVGAQPYEAIERLVQEAGATRRDASAGSAD